MTELTKRGVLCKLVKVYDPLGLVSPLTLEGKLIFRACLHGVGDPGLVGLVSFVFTLWGTQKKPTPLPVSKTYVWLNSTVVLHWISGRGDYKQFIQNRVMKIKEHENIVWQHVSSEKNPADLASRGGPVSESSLWWCGPNYRKKRNDHPIP